MVSGNLGSFWAFLKTVFGLGRAKGASEASERSSLVLPLGFHGPLCMHCSAAVWCFSLLAAAALGASAAAGLVAPCWNFWPLAVACFNNFQQCSRFPFLAKTGLIETPRGEHRRPPTLGASVIEFLFWQAFGRSCVLGVFGFLGNLGIVSVNNHFEETKPKAVQMIEKSSPEPSKIEAGGLQNRAWSPPRR